MKFSEKWLREWVNPPLTTAELTQQLTMAGFELESEMRAATPFNQVVVGKVISVERHPDADRLRCCKVDVGQEKPLDIVCGGLNVRVEIKVPVVLVGGWLSPEHVIKKTLLRGAESHGMICSERELGLSEQNDGNIMVLPADAPIGMDLNEYLQLDDRMIDIAVTPNRGDCLSIRGIAREVAALNHLKLPQKVPKIPAKKSADTFKVQVSASQECPYYSGCVIRYIKADAQTPVTIRERLRRSGMRSVNVVVDVLNYVMLELGQPLHAFDLEKLDQSLEVRLAKNNETVTLIDGKTIHLKSNTLVVADQKKVQAVAGIMGASDSAVQTQTQHIFIESAFFTPSHVTLTARQMGLSTESAMRFERGVDYQLPKMALERALELLLPLVGGEKGPIIEVCHQKYLPTRKPIILRSQAITRLLGISVDEKTVTKILTALGMEVKAKRGEWRVTPPSYRFDIAIEADLIEEVARVYGYEKIPEVVMTHAYGMSAIPESQLALSRIRHLLVDRSYHEIITFSFVEEKLNQLINPSLPPILLANPITRELSCMRTSLWPGLLEVLRYNEHRQASRVRLFEAGMCFIPNAQGEWQQVTQLAGLIAGERHATQWSEPNHQEIDFYDMKGDLSALLALTRDNYHFSQADCHPALHPGQSAAIYHNNRLCGFIGALHPRLVNELGLKNTPYLFEITLADIQVKRLPQYSPISRFPAIRRDLAIIVDQNLPATEVEALILVAAGRLLNKVEIFDIYAGEGIELGKKSVALGLTFQDPSRTLVDEEINQIIEQIVVSLTNKFNAKLRA